VTLRDRNPGTHHCRPSGNALRALRPGRGVGRAAGCGKRGSVGAALHGRRGGPVCRPLSGPMAAAAPSRKRPHTDDDAEADPGAKRTPPSVNPVNGTPFSAKYYELFEQRMKLPVSRFLDNLEGKLRKNQVVIVEGETGSGKTTQVSTCSRVCQLWAARQRGRVGGAVLGVLCGSLRSGGLPRVAAGVWCALGAPPPRPDSHLCACRFRRSRNSWSTPGLAPKRVGGWWAARSRGEWPPCPSRSALRTRWT